MLTGLSGATLSPRVRNAYFTALPIGTTFFSSFFAVQNCAQASISRRRFSNRSLRW